MKKFFLSFVTVMTLVVLSSAANADRWRDRDRDRDRGRDRGRRQYVVSIYNQGVVQCYGRDRVLSCRDVGNGRNHGCRAVWNGCEAWEGHGNRGGAGCEALCEGRY